jgi:hypothetical protein
MSDGVGGAGGSNGSSGASGVGGASDVGSTSESAASNAEASAAVDGAMSDVSSAEMSAEADSIAGAVDGYEGPTSAEAEQAKEAQATAEQEAGICIGTEDECAKQAAQREADEMTEDEAIQALDGAFLHDPTALTPAQVKGLEALADRPNTHPQAKQAIESFLQDHYDGVDSLGLNGQLGRFDTYPTNPAEW